MGRNVGYARVSTKEQNLERQLVMLKEYVEDDMIVTEHASGKNINRLGYQSLKVGLGKLVRGDTLYVTSLDRLSRNKEDIKNELKYFRDIGVRVKILNIPTTMTNLEIEGQEWIFDMINNILIEVYASIAENERKEIRLRQANGITAMPIDEKTGKRISIRTGKCIGRPAIEYPKNFEEYYVKWKNKELTGVATMNILNLKPNTFYKLVHRFEEEHNIDKVI